MDTTKFEDDDGFDGFADKGYHFRSIQCDKCKNHLSRSSKLYVCKAYPDGIPPQIWNDEIRHDKPLAGDNGIQFEAE